MVLFSLFVFAVGAQAQIASKSGKDNLTIAQNGTTRAVIVVSPDTGKSGEAAYL